jgi:hypothetical protein
MRPFRVYYLIQDNGDGSSTPLFFATQEEADAYEQAGNEAFEFFGDGVSYKDFDFDEDGNLVNGHEPYESL